MAPDLACDWATSSRRFAAFNVGRATSINGELATRLSGVKSFTGSNGSLGNKAALMAWLV